MSILAYNEVVRVSILISHEEASTSQLPNIHALVNELFPPKRRFWDNEGTDNDCFIYDVYKETHQLTYDLVGRFNCNTNLIMKFKTMQECIKYHCEKVLKDHFNDIKYKFAVYSLDTKIC